MSLSAPAQLELHPLLGDHAVLQRDKPILISGRGATPGSPVIVSLEGSGDAECMASTEGQWSVTLPARPASGPYSLAVRSVATDQEIRLRDLYLGEVWLCAGQSNMEWTLDASPSQYGLGSELIGPIRFLTVPHCVASEPQTAFVDGVSWVVGSQETIGPCSGVAAHFAQALSHQLPGVTIGLIVSAWGNTCITAWLPESVLAARPQYAVLQKARAADKPLPSQPGSEPTFHVDSGNEGEGRGWASPALSDSDWQPIPVPGVWQAYGIRGNGAVWYRQTIELPESWAGRDLHLDLGILDDFDETYFEGTRIGGIGPENPDAYAARRNYTIPGALVQPGPRILAIRIFDHYGDGGFTGFANELRVYPDGQEDAAIPLAGWWRCRAERILPRLSIRDFNFNHLTFNAMIAPLAPYQVRGGLWYQGENDTGSSQLYRSLLPDLIACWRGLWQDDAMPFGVVQLPNFGTALKEPGDSVWAEFRESQLVAATTTPNVGIVITVDVGDAKDIHPVNKRPVGERLAAWALSQVYGRTDIPYSGPIYKGYDIKADQIRVSFDHAAGLQAREGDSLTGFTIAGADHRFLRAEARVIGDAIEVSHPGVASPIAVRHAWEGNPSGNLINGDGLPAAPFRTDDWPVIGD